MSKKKLFVISASSGVGKSSLIKELCKIDSQLQVSISHTSRPKRKNEIEGVDYYFIDANVFSKMISENKFVEYALVYDNYYGTHIDILNNIKDGKNDIILEIDYQGAMQIKKLFPDTILIYILPPNLKEVEKRLKKRNTDNIEVINKRLKVIEQENLHSVDYNHTVINDNFKNAVSILYSIIKSYR